MFEVSLNNDSADRVWHRPANLKSQEIVMIRDRIFAIAAACSIALLLGLMVACSNADPTSSGDQILTLTVSSQETAIVDGETVSTIGLEAHVTDGLGDPEPGTQLTFASTAGTLSGARPGASGTSTMVADQNGVARESLSLSGSERASAVVTVASTKASDSIKFDGNSDATAIASIIDTPPGWQGVNEAVNFDGSGSSSSAGAITMYRWTIDSDSPDPGSPVQEVVEAVDAVALDRTYTTAQNLTVTLDVSDAPDAADLLAAGSEVPYGTPAMIQYRITDVAANEMPIADAGEDMTAECSGGGSTEVVLDGSGSSDANSTPGTNDDIVSFVWTEEVNPTLILELGEGEMLVASFEVGVHYVTLTVTDSRGEISEDLVIVEVVDTIAPEGSITAPEDGACFGPDDLPVVVEDDFSDTCSDDLTRTYEPGPGPEYSEHGDYDVTLTVTDPSGNSASDSVTFTIDTEAPVVEITWPQGGAYINPSSLPVDLFVSTNDDDGVEGGVTAERIYIEDCLVYDGMTYGDGDGLLTDENIEFSVTELCRLNEMCGWGDLNRPVMRVEADDCGGNVGESTFQWHGSIHLIPGECN